MGKLCKLLIKCSVSTRKPLVTITRGTCLGVEPAKICSKVMEELEISTDDVYNFNDMKITDKVTYILLKSASDRYRVICISDHGYAYFSLDSRFNNVHFTDSENVRLILHDISTNRRCWFSVDCYSFNPKFS